MGDPGNHEFLIVSNLHMSAGHDPRTRAYDRNEDFFYDAAFSRFIDHYLARAGAHGRSFRLVILGDFVDFLQIELGQEAGATCSAAAQAIDERLREAGAGLPA